MIGIPMVMTVNNKDALEIRTLAMIMVKIPRQQMAQHFAESDIDLSMLQYHIMSMALRHQPTIADISRMFGLDPSTLVPSVDALVKKGYLKRERDPEDRRRYPLHLTESGKKLHCDIGTQFGEDPLYTALNTLSQGEVDTLRNLLRKMILALPEGEVALEEFDERLAVHEPFKND